ncbi:hypothetical protein [Actinomadura sp. HBU206391]|uniref:hypothetical protein n=1 Tax=Actinomadura sp. HBU206391 TaxID=2731692 RepID=UPI00164F6930|nr:hypothetical protein [Actinomadura sp. HBU206391]MBC6462844.1 hypothetical protein [Actinomadura sp. HBU206391]
MRRILAASLTIGLLAVTACTGGKEGERPSSGVTAIKPPAGGQLRLVDRGLSVFPGPANGAEFTPEVKAARRDWDVVSWGILIENTSRWVAAFTVVDVDLVDAAGVVLSETDYRKRSKAETIVVLRPGERFGMGHTQPLEAPGRHPGKRLRAPADLQVQIGRSTWFPPNSRYDEFARITASEIKTPQNPGLTVSFMMESAYATSRRAWATSLFRNAAGKIIGGTSHCDDANRDQPDRIVLPGRARGHIARGLDYIVPHVAPARSELYLDPLPTKDLTHGLGSGQC